MFATINLVDVKSTIFKRLEVVKSYNQIFLKIIKYNLLNPKIFLCTQIMKSSPFFFFFKKTKTYCEIRFLQKHTMVRMQDKMSLFYIKTAENG